MKKGLLLWALSATLSLGLSAQQTAKPETALCKYDDGALVSSLSDNGQWMTLYALSTDGSNQGAGARLYSVSTKQTIELTGGINVDEVSSYSARDVDNAGNLVVGDLNLKPAYYSTQSKSWKELPYSSKLEYGKVEKITPDGHYAVGTVFSDFKGINNYGEGGVLWDLKTGKEVALTHLPVKDMAHNQTNMHRFLSISADGRYILGCMSFVYIPAGTDLGGVFYYIYDVQQQNYKVIGFTESDTKPWTPQVKGVSHITNAFMSNNGKYVTGSAHMLRFKSEADKFGDEFEAPFLYNVATGEMTVFDDEASREIGGWIVDNNGAVYGAELMNPYRTTSVYHQGYWVDYALGVKQHYGVDYVKDMDLECSGTPIAISDDSKTLAFMSSIFESYVIKTPDNFMDYVGTIDLLGSYSIFPAANSTISRLNKVNLNFPREVSLIGANNSVKLFNKLTDEQVETSSKITVKGREVTIEFKNGLLEDGLFELQIPAKTFSLLNNNKYTNAAIAVKYSGRAETPVKIIKTSPLENASVAKLEKGTNPIILNLDVDAKLNTEVAKGLLYRDNDQTPVANIFFEVEGATVTAYPATEQYLYKNHTYRVEILAGSFTDIMGNPATGSEKFVLNLRGIYEREISFEENVLFSDDLNTTGIKNFMYWDNDKHTYSDVAKSHGFSDTPVAQANYAWMPVRESESSADVALASTSMYSPAGKSDDWLVLPQIYIMDHLCQLKFQSQSYKKNKQDRLKVYVWEYDDVITNLSSELVERIRKEGKLIYNEVQSPGNEEEYLQNEWRDNELSLEQFKGKNVYIAFLNDNEDQSEVYIDNIQVLHNLPFFAQLTNEKTVVNQHELAIEGVVDVRHETNVYNDVTMTLVDAAGKTVDTIHQTGVSYKKGDKVKFKFSKPLPLKVGEENKFVVKLKFNDDENEVASVVKSLAFQPTQRVVLEEFTGTGCANCPLGIEAIHRLSTTYGDKFIPIAIHAYTGDELGKGVLNYASFLGLQAAPSARINRIEGMSLPMVNSSATNGFIMNAEPGEQPLWADLVAQELSKQVEADVTASVSYDANTKSYSVPVNVKYALSAEDLNLKVFAVVLENGCISDQSNNFFSVPDPLLGEWGKGGKYGSATVRNFSHNHVARGTYGTSFTGSADLLPNKVKAGETYTATLDIPVPATVSNVSKTEVVVMLFNGNTDKIINSCVARLDNSTGIDGVQNDAIEGVEVEVQGSTLYVAANEQVNVKVYSLSGSLLNQAQGCGELEIAVPEYKGVVLVNIATTEGSVTQKVIL